MPNYSTACYWARRAADLMRFKGLSTPGFSRLPAPFMGAIWAFDCATTGIRILVNSGGAVNAKATKAARLIAEGGETRAAIAAREEAAAYDLRAAAIEAARAARLSGAGPRLAAAEAPAAEAPAADLPPVALRLVAKAGGFELHNRDSVWIGPGLGLFETEAKARAWAEGRAAYPGGPRYTVEPPARLVALTARPDRARAAAIRQAFALAPVAPSLESPLLPLPREARQAVAAYGRGLI